MPPLFPEALYVLSERDQQVTWLDPILTKFTNTTAAASMDAGPLAVPDNRILLLTSAIFRLAGVIATAEVLRARVIVSPPSQTEPLVSIAEAEARTSLDRLFTQFSGAILIPASWRIFGRGTFSGVATQIIELSLSGVLLPVGNVQRI